MVISEACSSQVNTGQATVFAWAKSWASITPGEVDAVVLDPFSLFQTTPKRRSMNSLTFRNFAQSLTAARVPALEDFVSAHNRSVPSMDACVYFFKAKGAHCSGPKEGRGGHFAHRQSRMDSSLHHGTHSRG